MYNDKREKRQALIIQPVFGSGALALGNDVAK